MSLTYNVTSKIGLTVGANNVTDVYPDKVIATYPSYSNGEIPYSRNVNQFGFNGAFYYANLNINF
jgi:iron complex outermembrane receptor protein